MTDQFLRPRDVADRWGVTPRQVCLMAQRGELESLQIGRSVRIPLDTITRYEKEHTRRDRA